MVARRSGLADDLDLAAAGAPVLRAVRVQQHAHFGDGVEVDLLCHQAAGANFVGDDAVDDDVAPVAAGTADVRHGSAEAHAERIDGVLVAHARQEPHDGRHVSAEHLHLLDLFRRDQAAVLCFGDVHLRAPGFDDHGFAEVAEGQRQGAD